jgi:hypothetical protein
MLVKFYKSHPENPDSNKLELKCVTSVNYCQIVCYDFSLVRNHSFVQQIGLFEPTIIRHVVQIFFSIRNPID